MILTTTGAAVRVLPWTDKDGGTCYLIGGGSGRVSRAADDVESDQLDDAADALDWAADLLADDQAPAGDVRLLADCLAQSLREVYRVAESRGARLPEKIEQ